MLYQSASLPVVSCVCRAERAAVEAQKRARAAAKVSVKLQRQAEHEKRVALEAERLRWVCFRCALVARSAL